MNFLNTTVFEEDNKLRTKVSNQPTDKVIYTANQNVLMPLKSIAYSLALRFNKICYNRSELHNKCKRLLNTLTKRGYNKKRYYNTNQPCYFNSKKQVA